VIRPGRDSDAAGFIALIGACWAEYPGCVLDVDGELPELRALATPRITVSELSDRVVRRRRTAMPLAATRAEVRRPRPGAMRARRALPRLRPTQRRPAHGRSFAHGPRPPTRRPQ
jgi:hypothetical protein